METQMKYILRLLFIASLLNVSFCPLFAQWVQTNGPNGGNINCFTASGANLFAGTSSGVLISTDNGSSWSNAGLMSYRVQCLTECGGKLFAGTGNQGIFCTTDNGVSWTSVSTGQTNSDILCLTTIGTNIIAGTYGGVFLSTNNGTNWNRTGPIYSAMSLLTSGTNLFVGTMSGVYLSTNNGNNWIDVNTGFHDYGVYSLSASGGNLYAGAMQGGVYLSTNNGTRWTRMGLTVPIWSFATIGTNLFAAATSGVYLSTNNGASWTEVYQCVGDDYINTLAISGPYLLLGTKGYGTWRRPISEMVTSVEMSSNSQPAGFGLEQNYPNPFNPNTTINYRLPKNGHVTIKVYDILGNEVKTLVNEYKPAGEYSVNFDAGKLSSGMYIYRITAGGYTAAKKMTLIK
jgi:photosystem II stability/assembly factor-like uncharacterized protein